MVIKKPGQTYKFKSLKNDLLRLAIAFGFNNHGLADFEVIVVGDGNQGIEVLLGELVLEGDIGVGTTREGRELGDEGIECDVVVDGKDLGLATDAVELVYVD